LVKPAAVIDKISCFIHALDGTTEGGDAGQT